MSEDQAKVAAKIAAIAGEIKGMTKDSTNPHFKYDYTSIQETIRVIAPLMAAHNLAFIPSIERVERQGDLTTVYGQFSLICGETGQSIAVPWAGEGKDNQDKGINKAIRAAQKYFLLITFLASADDEKEADGSPPSQDRPVTKRTPDTRPLGQPPQSPDLIAAVLRGRGGWVKTDAGFKRDMGDTAQPIRNDTRQHVQATLAMGLAFEGATEQDIAENAQALLSWLYGVKSTKELTEKEGKAIEYAWLAGDGQLNEYAKPEMDGCLKAMPPL